MNNLSYASGAAALIVWLIFQFSTPKRVLAASENLAAMKPSLNAIKLLLVLGGIYWIGLGIFLTKAKAWFESSIVGIVGQLLLILLPVSLLRLTLWLEHKRKGNI